MIVTETWDMEQIEWWDLRRGEGFREAIGATGMQIEKHTDTVFSVLRFVSPKKALRFIDPLFHPSQHGRETVSFLMRAVEEGRLIAPPQVWVSPAEAAYFPEIPWFDERARILRFSGSRELTDDEHRRLVVGHEGRHRLWVAAELGETQVPVQLWVSMRDPESSKLKELTKELERENAELVERVRELELELGFDSEE